MGETCGYLWQKGWAEGNGGNMSVNVNDNISEEKPLGYNYYLVTATGSRARYTHQYPDRDILLIEVHEDSSQYNIIWGTGLPTSELPAHLLMHSWLAQNRPKSKAVLHTHPTAIIAVSHDPNLTDSVKLTEALYNVHPEVKLYLPEGVGLAGYQPPGSLALAEETVRVLPQYQAVVWPYHGCLATAPSIGRAFDIIDVLEKASRIRLDCLAAGYTPAKKP